MGFCQRRTSRSWEIKTVALLDLQTMLHSQWLIHTLYSTFPRVLKTIGYVHAPRFTDCTYPIGTPYGSPSPLPSYLPKSLSQVGQTVIRHLSALTHYCDKHLNPTFCCVDVYDWRKSDRLLHLISTRGQLADDFFQRAALKHTAFWWEFTVLVRLVQELCS